MADLENLSLDTTHKEAMIVSHEVTLEDIQERRIDVVAESVCGLIRRDLTDIIVDVCSNSVHEGIAKALSEKSDLLSGVYEGGVKTWECSLDLLEYLSSLDLSKALVLEIGCGSALPGIHCLKAGAERVDFSDYNQNVLTLVTIPNVLLNVSSETASVDEDGTLEATLDMKDMNLNGKARYFAGDWASLPPLLHKEYNVILTSETIYNKDYHSRLLDLIESTLSKNGICYIAAKHTYFGCSGTLFDFIALVKSRGKMRAETIKVFAQQGIRREIVSLSWISFV